MKQEQPAENEPSSDIGALVNAFRYFNEATSSLNIAYSRLEARIEHLTQQLEEKDRELYSRLRELDRVTRYLNCLLEGQSSGVIAIDMDGNITVFNRSAGEILGIDAEPAIGKHYTDIVGEDSLESSALHTLHHGPEMRGEEKIFPGTDRRVEVSTTWVVDSFGERIGVIEIFDDISTLRHMEERYEQQKTLSAMGEMASAVAHELRNPLAGIGGFAAILKEDLADDPSKQKWVGKILQGVKDLERVAENLLFLTRRTEIKRYQVDLKSLLSDIVQLLQAEIHRNGAEVDIVTRFPEENVLISADAELLKMIFTNLGRNGLQALENRGEVTFRLEWKLLANRVKVEVHDNGCGIPEDNLTKLFNPFFTTHSNGTGLGLSLVKKAIDLHRGQISIESQVGEGSKFEVLLPIKAFTPKVERVSD